MLDMDDVADGTSMVIKAEMEYRASAAIMLAEEILQIVEGFVEVPCKSVGSFEEP